MILRACFNLFLLSLALGARREAIGNVLGADDRLIDDIVIVIAHRIAVAVNLDLRSIRKRHLVSALAEALKLLAGFAQALFAFHKRLVAFALHDGELLLKLSNPLLRRHHRSDEFGSPALLFLLHRASAFRQPIAVRRLREYVGNRLAAISSQRSEPQQQCLRRNRRKIEIIYRAISQRNFPKYISLIYFTQNYLIMQMQENSPFISVSWHFVYNKIIMVSDPYEIILDHLRKIRADLDDVKKLRGEMREGFASVRAHQAATHGDQALLERRVVTLESDMDRIKRRLDLSDKPSGQ